MHCITISCQDRITAEIRVDFHGVFTTLFRIETDNDLKLIIVSMSMVLTGLLMVFAIGSVGVPLI
jgi:hypothetical protein